MKDYLVLACEALRVELDHIAEAMPGAPEIVYLQQSLHDQPDEMRRVLQEKISSFEKQRSEIRRIVMAFGLCGRGTSGVVPMRVELVYPRVHDCIPLYLGVMQADANDSSQNGGILWLSAGMLEYGRIASHLLTDRYRLYEEKFGKAKAEKMIRAENAIFANYQGACHIKWDGLRKNYGKLAEALAREINLDFTEMRGNSDYLAELLAGGHDPRRFLTVKPGETLGMDTEGNITAEPLSAHGRI